MKKEIKENFANIDKRDKFLSGSFIRFLNSISLFFDSAEIRVSLYNFTRQLRSKKADVSYVYFSLLDASGIFRTLAYNQNAKVSEKEQGRFSNSRFRSCGNCTQVGVLFESVRKKGNLAIR